MSLDSLKQQIRENAVRKCIFQKLPDRVSEWQKCPAFRVQPTADGCPTCFYWDRFRCCKNDRDVGVPSTIEVSIVLKLVGDLEKTLIDKLEKELRRIWSESDTQMILSVVEEVLKK